MLLLIFTGIFVYVLYLTIVSNIMDIKGKVALVTGAAIGIGFEISQELLRNEAQGIVLTDINETNGKKALEKLNEIYKNKKIVFIKADVTKDIEFEDAFKKAVEIFGKLDILVNNAGIMNDLNYKLEIDINLTGVVRGIMFGLKYMGKNKSGNGGVILNISSDTAFHLQHCFPIYSSTKAAIVNLTRAFGHSFHYNLTGVAVIALCPGKTETALQAVDYLLEGCLDEMKNIIAEQDIQMPDAVSRAAKYVIKNGKPGSIWTIVQNNLYSINMPTLESMQQIVIKKI